MEIVPPSEMNAEPIRQHNKSATTTKTTPASKHTSLHPQSQQCPHHHHHYHNHNQQRPQSRNTQNNPLSPTQQPKDEGIASFDTQAQSSMAYQHKHALHRLRRLKKRSPHRNLVISFVPRLRVSIINRLDFFNRYSKQEQEVLSCFDFLDDLVLNYCDGGLDSPNYSQKLYETMIYELI